MWIGDRAGSDGEGIAFQTIDWSGQEDSEYDEEEGTHDSCV